MVGYSRRMERDEADTLNRFNAVRAQLLEPRIAKHRGRVVKYTGDGCLLEFASAGDAADCAVEIQQGLTERNAALPEEQCIRFRIGINLGDVIPDGSEIYGDGVNLAVWLETIAPPDGIMISAAVHEQMVGRNSYRFLDLGYRRSKKIDRAVHIFRLCRPDEAPRNGTTAPDVFAIGEAPHLSILVLPFRTLGSTPNDDYFAEGITEDVITDLSRIPGSFVIARNTAFAYKDRQADITTIGRELNVRYVLEGSVRRAGGKVRVDSKLIDAMSATYVWAGRFDSHERDLLDLQDELTGRIATSLDYHLTDLESRRSLPERPDNLNAIDLTMRGWSTVNRPVTRDNLVAARRLFEAALRLEPNYAHPMVGLAETHLFEVGNRWSADPKAQLLCAEQAIARALELEPHHARGHFVRGIQLRTMKQFDKSLAAFERALELNRNLAAAYAQIGLVKLFVGRPEETFGYVEKAIRLSPRDFNLGGWLFMTAAAHLCLEQDQQAIEVLHRGITENPALPINYFMLAAAYALTDRLDAARSTLAEYDRLVPKMTLKRLTAEGWSDHPEYTKRVARIGSALLLAGMPAE